MNRWDGIRTHDITHIRSFSEGTQGATGLVEVRGKQFVYKICKYLTFLARHEYDVMTELYTRLRFLPHFCHPKALLNLRIHADFHKQGVNPFEIKEGKGQSIHADVLFIEYISPAASLFDIAERMDVPRDAILSCIKQVLAALALANRACAFTHYDLHASNVLIRPCHPETVLVYPLAGKDDKNDKDDKNVFKTHAGTPELYTPDLYTAIPTHGYIAVIIDFGYSTCSATQTRPIRCPLSMSNIGYWSPLSIPAVDTRRFMMSMVESLRGVRGKERDHGMMKRVVDHLFSSRDDDIYATNWIHGWGNNRDSISATRFLWECATFNVRTVGIFSTHGLVCSEILQSLCTYTPPNYIQNTGNTADTGNTMNTGIATSTSPDWSLLRRACCAMMHDFKKVETAVGCDDHLVLTIFRDMVDWVREHPCVNNVSTEDETDAFSDHVFRTVRGVASFCLLDNIHFGRILASIRVIGEQFQAYIVSTLGRVRDQTNTNSSVPLARHVLAMIQVVAPDVTYRYSCASLVRIWDNTGSFKSHRLACAPRVNEYHPFEIGAVLARDAGVIAPPQIRPRQNHQNHQNVEPDTAVQPQPDSESEYEEIEIDVETDVEVSEYEDDEDD